MLLLYQILRAGGQGFEPQLMASKATVLPLDDPPILFILELPNYFLLLNSFIF